jgi:hypothetical protein
MELRANISDATAACCNYLLALLAPADIAASILQEHHAPATEPYGPLTEVIAQQHRWNKLVPHLTGLHARAVAQERALFEDDIDEQVLTDGSQELFGMTLRQDWEPHYARPQYSSSSIKFPAPQTRFVSACIDLPEPREEVGDPHVRDAFVDLLAPRTDSATCSVKVTTTEGDHRHAIAQACASSGRLSTLLAPIATSDAFAWLAWLGANGGLVPSLSSRKGSAIGRSRAWQCVSSIAGFAEEWPLTADVFHKVCGNLNWYLWSNEGAASGMHFAIHDTSEELGITISIDPTAVRQDHREARTASM